MTEEQRLIEKLQHIEALYAGAATTGERQAAGLARERIRARLRDHQPSDPPVEFSFKLRDQWSSKLFIALLRRYGIEPYRYPRQRYTTVMARLPTQFLNEILWPEFVELDRTLAQFLRETTDRVISQGIHASTAEVKIAPEGLPAPGPATREMESATGEISG